MRGIELSPTKNFSIELEPNAPVRGVLGFKRQPRTAVRRGRCNLGANEQINHLKWHRRRVFHRLAAVAVALFISNHELGAGPHRAYGQGKG